MNKISWDDYFLSMAYVAATRSPDVHTKCGAVIVDRENRIISVGYNGPVRGLDDSKVPLDRPAKHPWMIHAEINALATANLEDKDYKIYITGHPCLNCLQTCIQNGINTFIFEGRQRIHSLEGQENSFLDFFRAAGNVYTSKPGERDYIPCSSYSYGQRILIQGYGKDIFIDPINGEYKALDRAHDKISSAYLRGLTWK